MAKIYLLFGAEKFVFYLFIIYLFIICYVSAMDLNSGASMNRTDKIVSF